MSNTIPWQGFWEELIHEAQAANTDSKHSSTEPALPRVRDTMKQNTLEEFFIDQIRDLYDAEKQLVKALPKMAKAASSSDLQEAFRSHLAETENQVTRLEQVFESIGVPAKSKPCAGMKGLLEEGSEEMEQEEGPLRDLAMIAAAQRVEHYEIAAYGTARSAADRMGNETAVGLLEETQQEEEAADSKLTDIALTIYEDLPDASGEEKQENRPEPTRGSRATQATVGSKGPGQAGGGNPKRAGGATGR